MPIFLIRKLVTVYGSDEDKDSTKSEPIGYFNGCAEEARVYCDSKNDEIEAKNSAHNVWGHKRHKFYMEFLPLFNFFLLPFFLSLLIIYIF
jgi:hypothetical protein